MPNFLLKCDTAKDLHELIVGLHVSRESPDLDLEGLKRTPRSRAQVSDLPAIPGDQISVCEQHAYRKYTILQLQ